jgi:hypothetical protein
MPVYTFELRDGSEPISDETGMILRDRDHAVEYAEEVVGELMRGREAETRSWCLDVYADDGCVFEIPFASMDRTLDTFRPEFRSMIEAGCNRQRSVKEVLHASRVTAREAQALVAMSRGKPYLAAECGRATIRDCLPKPWRSSNA